MPIGPGLVASSPPATSLEITRPSGISHDSSVRTLTANPVRRSAAVASLREAPSMSGTTARAVPRLTRSTRSRSARSTRARGAGDCEITRPAGTDSEYERPPISSGASAGSTWAACGERRARLLHGQARDLRHLDDPIGVRDRRPDEGERGRRCDADRHEGHPAATAALAGRMAPRGLERSRLERLGEDGRRPLGSLDRVDDRRSDRRHRGTETLADLDRTRPVCQVPARAGHRRAPLPRAERPPRTRAATAPSRAPGEARPQAGRRPRTGCAPTAARRAGSRARTCRWRSRCRRPEPARATSTRVSRATCPGS